MLTLYTKNLCPYCDGAKHYLTQNNIAFEEINLAEDVEALRFIKEEKGHRTVPQIYYKGQLFVEGGYDGLRKLLPYEIEKRINEFNSKQDL